MRSLGIALLVLSLALLGYGVLALVDWILDALGLPLLFGLDLSLVVALLLGLACGWLGLALVGWTSSLPPSTSSDS